MLQLYFFAALALFALPLFYVCSVRSFSFGLVWSWLSSGEVIIFSTNDWGMSGAPNELYHERIHDPHPRSAVARK
jgi:hypothetical protein